jgi:group I intron endonuclease
MGKYSDSKMVVYQMRNKYDDSVYIGSTVDSHKRKLEHFGRLRNGKHENMFLQEAYNKYGMHEFVFEILEIIDNESKLIEREQYYINTLKINNCRVYNISPTAGNQTGYRFSKESIIKMRESLKGKCAGEKHYNYGKTLSAETKAKLSNALKGEKHPCYNKHLSQETKDKIGNAQLGELNHIAKLKSSDVMEIKIMLNRKISMQKIADKFCVSRRAIRNIKENKSWKHIIIQEAI